MKIFLTGGTGYLGKRLAQRLAQEGHKVRLLYRKTSNLESLDLPLIEPVEGDVTVRESLKGTMDGCDVVFHSAALVKRWVRNPHLFDKVNVEGCANVMEEAMSQGIQRVLYTSSFIALGPSSEGSSLTEQDLKPRDHFHNDYERTKYLGVEVAKGFSKKGLDVVILIPTVIYGPGEMTEGNYVSKIIEDFIQGRLPGILGDGTQRWNYAYVEDVVEGHMLAMKKGKPGQAYILGGETITMNEFMLLLAQMTGKRGPRLHIPFALAKGVAVLQEAMALLFDGTPQLTRHEVEVFKHHWAYDTTKAMKELGYRPRPFKDGLKSTLDWIKNQKGLE